MSRDEESERIDLLLALSLAFGETPDSARGVGAGESGGEGAPSSGGARDPLDALSALGPTARHAVERRAEWHARLPPQKQRAWLAHMLGLARESLPRLDEHVHPTHVVEALRDEPPRVRRLVVDHLPPALAGAAAAQLGAGSGAGGGDASGREAGGTPSPEVEAVVRRQFLSRFETFASLRRTTPVEQLSGVELARLVRLLGVRETAVACRGIGAIEAVASFLRRFAPEDAHAIAAHLKSLTEVEPRRVAAAELIVREALLAEPEDPAAMLDRAGLRLLAVALSGRENGARLRYAAQKLPVEAARWLEASARQADPVAAATDAETRRAVAREAEAVAAGLQRGRQHDARRHAPRQPQRGDAAARPGAPAPRESNT